MARTGADSRDRQVVAKRLAVEMLAKGFADIAIVDSVQGGKGVTPSEFVQRYSNNDHVVRNEGD